MVSVENIKLRKEELVERLFSLKSFKTDPLRITFEPKYPKLLLLIIISIGTYYLFSGEFIKSWLSSINNFGYFYSFLFGGLFTFGFSTPMSIAFFLSYSPENIILTSIIGGLGAIVADLMIFKFIKFSMMDEFEAIKQEKVFIKFNNVFKLKFSEKLKLYLNFLFAGIIIASPLPDEVGVAMLAGLSNISPKTLAVLSFVFNSLGIFLMLYYF
jgi:hypothetical protein